MYKIDSADQLIGCEVEGFIQFILNNRVLGHVFNQSETYFYLEKYVKGTRSLYRESRPELVYKQIQTHRRIWSAAQCNKWRTELSLSLG